MGWLTKLIPGGLAAKAVIYGLVFTLGLSVGNHWATERALQRELDHSAKRMAKNHEELIGWYADKMKELRVAREQQADADAAAYALMQRGKADAERATARARAEIAKLAEGKPNVQPIPLPASDPGCVLPDGMRRTLDTASGAGPAISGDTEAEAPGFPDGPDTTAQALTCQQLAMGYVALSEHSRLLTAWILAWQRWAFEALR